MQSVSSRIWTRVAVSISYDDNNYTTGTSWNEEHVPERRVCDCLPNLPTSRMQNKVNFFAEINRFEFSVFLLLDQLSYKS